MRLATDSYEDRENPSGWSDAGLTRLHHTIVWNDKSCWSLVAVPNYKIVKDNRFSAKDWTTEFEEIEAPPLTDMLFRIDHLYLVDGIFRAASRRQSCTADVSLVIRHRGACTQRVRARIRHLLPPLGV
jgi:hypothetical protein